MNSIEISSSQVYQAKRYRNTVLTTQSNDYFLTIYLTGKWAGKYVILPRPANVELEEMWEKIGGKLFWRTKRQTKTLFYKCILDYYCTKELGHPIHGLLNYSRVNDHKKS